MVKLAYTVIVEFDDDAPQHAWNLPKDYIEFALSNQQFIVSFSCDGGHLVNDEGAAL